MQYTLMGAAAIALTIAVHLIDGLIGLIALSMIMIFIACFLIPFINLP